MARPPTPAVSQPAADASTAGTVFWEGVHLESVSGHEAAFLVPLEKDDAFLNHGVQDPRDRFLYIGVRTQSGLVDMVEVTLPVGLPFDGHAAAQDNVSLALAIAHRVGQETGAAAEEGGNQRLPRGLGKGPGSLADRLESLQVGPMARKERDKALAGMDPKNAQRLSSRLSSHPKMGVSFYSFSDDSMGPRDVRKKGFLEACNIMHGVKMESGVRQTAAPSPWRTAQRQNPGVASLVEMVCAKGRAPSLLAVGERDDAWASALAVGLAGEPRDPAHRQNTVAFVKGVLVGPMREENRDVLARHLSALAAHPHHVAEQALPPHHMDTPGLSVWGSREPIDIAYQKGITRADVLGEALSFAERVDAMSPYAEQKPRWDGAVDRLLDQSPSRVGSFGGQVMNMIAVHGQDPVDRAAITTLTSFVEPAAAAVEKEVPRLGDDATWREATSVGSLRSRALSLALGEGQVSLDELPGHVWGVLDTSRRLLSLGDVDTSVEREDNRRVFLRNPATAALPADRAALPVDASKFLDDLEQGKALLGRSAGVESGGAEARPAARRGGADAR